jgi:cbb3-type cytochrome oxidase cytochrome c subunit
MPATEETYRRTPTLHIVFAVTSILMTLVIVWMILADHLRPWKKVQRRFHDVELAKLEASKQEKLREQQAQHAAELEEIDREIAAARQLEQQNAREIRVQQARIQRLRGQFEGLDTRRKFKKAELDSLRSFYDGFIDRDEQARARAFLVETIAPAERELLEITAQYEAKQQELREAEARLVELRGNIDEKLKKRESLTREVERIARVIEQKQAQYGEGSLKSLILGAIRGLPIIDLAAPPTKIQQISLPELTINYNFKDVPRYDRCTTCHLGIDRIGYDKGVDGQEMEAVYRAHPHLTDGATTVDPKGRTVAAGLYLDANGPHPINSFGCTICHGGQGSGTTFTYASHTPDTREERKEWEDRHDWHEIHHWDFPMLQTRFLESSCLKCHHAVTDIPQAKQLQAGYERITKYGCTGCHTIGGEGVDGPDLTDNRQVGPNLAHIASKDSRDWVARWIRNPHAFRPDSRMPRFYDVTNNSAPQDQPKVAAEVQAMTHYLFAVSTPPTGFADVSSGGDAERGKSLFFQKGCLACHAHRPYKAEDLAPELRSKFQPGPDPAETFAAETLPEAARPYASANFGPNLVNMAAKFQNAEQGHAWLTNWIHAPENYHAKSLMPNLQLTLEEASDIAAWILSVPANWPVEVELPDVGSKEVEEGLDELVKLYLSKSKTYYDPAEVQGGPEALAKLYLDRTRSPRMRTVLLSQIDATVAGMSRDEKLMYIGQRTISRLGCFGCHNIPGFEDAKPIGTPLNDWGSKSPTKLDFAHIAEYLTDHRVVDEQGAVHYDGTDEFYREQLLDQTRIGFLYQKLHRPRSYDYKKTREELKSWDDRLRMPQFAWANDPQAIEEVMTFVLGLTGEKVNLRYLPAYEPAKAALAQGERLLNRYNCRGCHTLAMPKYTIPAGTPVTAALPDFASNVEISYDNRKDDYLEFYPGLSHEPDRVYRLAEEATPEERNDPKTVLLPREDGKAPIVIEGMPVATSDEEDDQGQVHRRVAVQLWKPVTIRGYTFNVGDNVTVALEQVEQTPADGGDFAWLYATTEAERTGGNFAAIWNRLPPPLIREGLKVQTPWLTAFLKDPYAIRPATNLRMPRFHYGSKPEPTQEPIAGVPPTPDPVRHSAREDIDAETRDLANYFAAVDGAEFPYQDIPQRDRAYLSEQESRHPDYLAGGWQIVTKGLCVQCHAIGPYKPTGGAEVVNGPDLRQVNDRFRPEYLFEWLARPTRLVPYTAMPQNIPPHLPAGSPTPTFVPKSFETSQLDQVRAMRDMLLNYVRAVEGQLAGPAPAAETPPRPPAAGSD